MDEYDDFGALIDVRVRTANGYEWRPGVISRKLNTHSATVHEVCLGDTPGIDTCRVLSTDIRPRGEG